MSFNLPLDIVVENLENLFENLNISLDTNCQPKMTQNQQVPVLKPEFLSMIPEFNGEPELLPRFLEISEKVVNRFYNPHNIDDFQNEYLMSSIRSKIVGKAALNLSGLVLNTWQDLKTNLLYAYADKRDSYTLCLELSNLKQGNENAFDFYNKIQKLLNLQTCYLKTHHSPNEANVLAAYFTNYALRILLRGLKEPIGSLMRTKNPKNLAEALNMLTNDFQLDTSQSSTTKNPQGRFVPNNPNPKFLQNQNKPFNQNFRPKNDSHPQNNFRPPFQNNHQFRQPFQPVTNPAQKRTFSNVTPHNFTPNKINPNRPTPMSISTNNTYRPNSGQLHNLNSIDEFNSDPQIENYDESNSQQTDQLESLNQDFLELTASESLNY